MASVDPGGRRIIKRNEFVHALRQGRERLAQRSFLPRFDLILQFIEFLFFLHGGSLDDDGIIHETVDDGR